MSPSTLVPVCQYIGLLYAFTSLINHAHYIAFDKCSASVTL